LNGGGRKGPRVLEKMGLGGPPKKTGRGKEARGQADAYDPKPAKNETQGGGGGGVGDAAQEDR